MRMMKNNNNEIVTVIGIDHGYGNMKTATRCFPSGVARYDKEPIFQNNLLVYNGMYYQIGEEHKEFCAEKTQDEDYYVLTLAAIARELDGKGMNRATVHIAAGLPLTWVATQKEDFQKYLLQNEIVDSGKHLPGIFCLSEQICRNGLLQIIQILNSNIFHDNFSSSLFLIFGIGLLCLLLIKFFCSLELSP